MTAHRTATLLCAVAALVAVGAASSWAAPSGKEYLPKVPSATGQQSPERAQATGGSAGTSSTATTPSPTGAKKQKTDRQAGGKKKKDGSTTAVPVSSGDSGSSGGGSGLLPVVLLIAAGVIVVAVGMTLRRRGGGEPDAGEGGPAPDDRGPDETPNERPTPDGEIVAGGENAP